MDGEKWKTCRQVQVACAGCGKMDSCTVSPDLSAFKCWRDGGRIIRADDPPHHPDTIKNASAWLTLQLAAEQLGAKLGTPTGTWRYLDAAGNPVMGVIRFDGAEGKQYRPLRHVDGVWRIGDPPAPLPLYRLPEVLKATRVYVCEGEKAAEDQLALRIEIPEQMTADFTDPLGRMRTLDAGTHEFST
jgi:hypothetical protein